MSPAVFLDRDGTLIEDCGDLSREEQVVFFDDTFTALGRLAAFFKLFIVTNQPGIGKKVLSTSDVSRVNDHVVLNLLKHGIGIQEVYVCPHQRTENCSCIKPNPHFLLSAAEKHGLDLRASFVVGDHPHDVQLALNAGAMGIYLLTGHGRMHLEEVPYNTLVAETISGAVDMIFLLREGLCPASPGKE